MYEYIEKILLLENHSAKNAETRGKPQDMEINIQSKKLVRVLLSSVGAKWVWGGVD